MTEAEQSAPPSLDPKSRGCWIPALIGAALAFMLWSGVQRIVASTGPWAIASARNAVAESGLHADDRARILGQVDRLAAALDKGDLDAQGVTRGVQAILQDPLIPQLTLDDIRARRLVASDLSEEEQHAADKELALLASLFEAREVEFVELLDVFGPLAKPGDDGVRSELDDAGLRALIERASAAVAAATAKPQGSVEKLDPARLETVDRESLLGRLERQIDELVL